MFAEIKKDGHNRLAILLQRIESDVMLNHVVPAIRKLLPDVKFITKHDSLLPASLLVSGDADQVANIMTDTIEEVTGLRPKLKIKLAQTDFSTLQSSIQSNTSTSSITTTNTTPSLSLYPIMRTTLLQVTDSEKEKRCGLSEKMTKKEKKIVSKILKKKQASAVAALPVSSVPGNHHPGRGFHLTRLSND